jgi:uncharacterized membrane-anchored protein YitT (DUF2179 family)
LIVAGSLLTSTTMVLFMIPAQLAAGGVSGIAQIINFYTGWPIGVMTIIGNIPLLWLGWRYLGGPRFALRTIIAVTIFSIGVDILPNFLPPDGLTDDLLLNALYGAVIGGIGYALVYRGQGTSGGTDILGRILASRLGLPVSQTYLITDALTMFLAGLAFSWEHALYAIILLYVSGLTVESVMQGSRVVRTATIITTQPEAVTEGVLHGLRRGLTSFDAVGAYTGESRQVLYCVVSRSEVERLKTLVAEADPQAFVVIGHAYEALGEGFKHITDG